MALNIVAIGGGEVRSGETLAIDRRFVSLADKLRPNLLFIPTANQDAESYIEAVEHAYGDRLGCNVDTLRLWGKDGGPQTIAKKMEAADLIYVGGGNTKAMLAKWSELGVDRALKELATAGVPVGGVSAGAICWFRVGNSDWPQYEGVPDILTDRLECLGLVDLVVCPHARCEAFRLGDFRRMMRLETGVGVALDDGCALQIQGTRYRFIGSIPEARAHVVPGGENEADYQIEELHDDFRSLSELQARYSG